MLISDNKYLFYCDKLPLSYITHAAEMVEMIWQSLKAINLQIGLII